LYNIFNYSGNFNFYADSKLVSVSPLQFLEFEHFARYFFLQWAATERFARSRSIAREAVGKTFLKIDHFVASIILRKASYEALAARGDSASLRACRRKNFLAFGGGRSGQLHSPNISPFP